MHECLFVMIISKSEKKSRTENFRKKAKVICYRLCSHLPNDVEQSMGFVVCHPTRKYSGWKKSGSFFYAKMNRFIFILEGYIEGLKDSKFAQ